MPENLDFDHVGANGERVRVEGLNKAVRALTAAGVDATDIKEIMRGIGTVVGRDARPPERTGRLASTIRAGASKTKAVIRAGGARAVYAGVVHYGDPHTKRLAQPFLTEAVQKDKGKSLALLGIGIDEILKKHDLK